VVALLRDLGPLGGWLCMAWIAAVFMLMIAGGFGRLLARRWPDKASISSLASTPAPGGDAGG
jgi:hypothetical protein